MDNALVHLVHNLKRPRVMVVGDLMLDRYVWGNVDRISPEGPIPVLRVEKTEDRLGGAAGVAGILRVLEADVSLVGVLGDDDAGRRCRHLLDERGIDSSMIRTEPARKTVVKERLIGRAEQKHMQQMLRVDYEASTPFAEDAVEGMAQQLKERIKDYDIVLISDYSKGACQPAVVQKLVEACRLRGIRVLADPGRLAGDLRAFRGCSAVTPNRREAAAATGQQLTELAAAGTAAQQLFRELELEAGLITLDRDGMVLADAQGWQHFAARPRDVHDITGAGDVVLATLGLILAGGHGYPDAIRVANAAAGLSVESIGVTAVSRREIINDLLRHSSSRIDKLVSREVLTQEMARLRYAGRRIVFTNGCFDLLHTGHIHLLREAKSLGDVLVVGLNSDASVRRLGKGDNRPINGETARAQILGALECVDFICIFEEETPASLVEAIRPAIMVKGADYRSKFVAGKEFVESYGGRLHLVELTPEQSTTGTIGRIKSL